MHPGVGSTGSVNPQANASGEAGQRSFQFPLDGPRSRLSLEPGEVRAVVFDPCPVTDGRALSGANLGVALTGVAGRIR
jgi:hypothetical protein